ncbi:MAG: PQQ-binding-like beta-propeller repeat protein [Pseudomonadota bacterium]|nr:PQQ-binding-like beta-propeller repeat protein [Pseudomonadota bacterium]
MTRQFIFDGIRRLCLRDKFDRPISSSGGIQNWLIDLRPALLQRELLQAIAALFWERFSNKGPFQICTVESAGIPLLTAILLQAPSGRAGLSGVIIRKTRKSTGLGNLIEGKLTDDPIVLIDDILNSAKSAEFARNALVSEGKTIAEMFAIIDYHSQKGEQWRHAHNIKIDSVFSLSEFGLTLEPSRPLPPQTYRELWRKIVPGGFAYHVVPKSTPALVGDMIYRGCDAGILHAFDINTGEIVWAYEARGASPRKGIWSSPAVHDGRVYYAAYNGVVYAVDTKTGQEIWSQPCCEWIGSSPLVLPAHNLLMIGLEYQRPWAQGSLTALNLATGAKVWEHGVAKFEHGSASHWSGGDLVIWGTADHKVVALKPATGELVWTFATRRSVKYPAAIDETRNLVAFASFDCSIYLLDVATGVKRGEWLTNDICYTTPLFAGDKLFCGSGDRHLYVIDLNTNQLIRKIEFDARIYSSPRLVGNRVIFGTNGGRIIEIDVNTLETVGVLQLPDAITNAPVFADDGKRMFVSSYMNHLFAFERL